VSQNVSHGIGYIKGRNAAAGRVLTSVCITVHGHGRLAVACNCCGNVCIVGVFMDVCEDGAPEGV